MPHAEDFLPAHPKVASGYEDPRCGTCHEFEHCALCHEKHVHPGFAGVEPLRGVEP
jgi:hypothetical protein